MTPAFDSDRFARVDEPDLTTICVPSREAGEIEALAASANERSRVEAVAQLGVWFPTIDFGEVTQTTDATTLHVGRAVEGLVDELDPHTLLTSLLSQRSLRPPQIRLARDGVDGDVERVLERAQPQPLGRVGVRPAVLAKAMHDGYTIVLDGVDLRDERSTRLVEVFERAFATTVTINGYLSLRPHTSFGAHWDTQEVLILQLLGRKDWAVHQPVALSMTRESHHRDVIGEEVWEGRIGVGDVLYVPRGWAHRVSGIDELSYHYTITIARLHGVDTLQHVVERVAERTTRGDQVGSAPMTAAAVEWETGLDDAELSEVDDAVANRVARHRFAVVARPTQRLSQVRHALTGGGAPLMVRFPFGGGWLVSGLDERHRVVLSAGQKQFVVDRDLVATLMRWSDGLVHLVTSPDEAAFAQHLVRLDVLEVVSESVPWPFRLAKH